MSGMSKVWEHTNVPMSVMNPIIKPWPFRGWSMDMIGKINLPSNKGHQFILAITDYFTKWVEAIPMKSVASKDIINFVKEHVIHRFRIPQTSTTDGGRSSYQRTSKNSLLTWASS
jgi:hypothetical protein